MVTTALEETWPTDGKKALFLGEWCRLFSRKTKWQSMESAVAEYHWDDREKLNRDYIYLQNFHYRLLSALTANLNVLHGTKYTERYWQILIGPWLGTFVQILFDRWTSITREIAKNSFTRCMLLRRTDDELIPNDMNEFNKLFVEDNWNEMIYGEVLKYEGANFSYIAPNKTSSEKQNNYESEGDKFAKVKVIDKIKKIYDKYVSINGKIFLLATYLPVTENIRLQLFLKQMPKTWSQSKIQRFEYSRTKRTWKIDICDQSKFEKFCTTLIPMHMPKAYIEGYEALKSMPDHNRWPSKAKAIFTSNSHSSNDVFKVWAAEQTEMKVPLYIGQHGGHYGIAKWNFFEDHEIDISDKYLSWGWSGNINKIVPIGNFKDIGKKIKPSLHGTAVMVQTALSRYSYHLFNAPISFKQWQDCFVSQIEFVKLLSPNIKNELIVRLYPYDFRCEQKLRWKHELPNIKFSEGDETIASLLERSRIYISTYNATTFLESLSMNYPTLIYWDEKYWEIRDVAKPYFQELSEVGIFHHTPESAAMHLNSIWADVGAWWSSERVQNARERFCLQYTDNSKTMVKKMVEVLSR